MHFTRLEHLPTIAREGLLCDRIAQHRRLLQVEIGEPRIKERRRRRRVTAGPRGVVADYVPFYFAPRSPMMYSIHKGNVPSYSEGCEDVVYLVTTVEDVVAAGCAVVVTDRNAVLSVATMSADLNDLDLLIDWALMRQQAWHNTDAEPDRMERRMAELLVHGSVPWRAFDEVVAPSTSCAARAASALKNASSVPPIVVRRGWYF